MIVRLYKRINNLSVPSIKIQFANPDNLQLSLNEYSLLDTGADITLIPYFLIEELNLSRIREENRIRVKGFNNSIMDGLPFFLSFSFDAKTFFDSIVYELSEIELNEIVIGRNILNRFSITFNGINQRIMIDY